MTRVLGPQQHDGDGKTHVLIIGVGRYKHLPGGDGPVTAGLSQLGQLASPPVSARALADWFTGGSYRNPEAPLGSVELLLSDANGQQYTPQNGDPQVKVEDATLPNIELAFNEWYKRCDGHVDNVAFFYFCGHGLQRENVLILPEDFARNPNNKWASAIDFSSTYRGMGECQAKTQYYVIDACRQWMTSMLQSLDIQKSPTLKEAVISKLRSRSAPQLFATGQGLPAFGDTGGVSRLTTSLLEGLSGGAAMYQSGRWRVTTSTLGEAVQALVNLKNANLPKPEKQCVDPAIPEYTEGQRVLHVLKPGDVPEVVVDFKCIPNSVLEGARFYYEQQGERKDAPEMGLWLPKIRAGDYSFGVSFDNGRYRADPLPTERIRPPVYSVELETQEV